MSTYHVEGGREPFIRLDRDRVLAGVLPRKGHSFLGYFILSIIFFPLALILAYAVRDRRPDWPREPW